MEVKEYIPEHYLQSVNEGDSRLIELDDNGFSNYGGPSFTIFVAPPDSQVIDVVGDNTSIENSSFGHVFIGLKGINPDGNENYNLISNNCIDFVSDFLEKSGANGIKLAETPKKNLKNKGDSKRIRYFINKIK